MDLQKELRKVARLIRKSADPSHLWNELLAITQQQSNHKLRNPGLAEDIRSISEQLSLLWSKEPLPRHISFLYFGIFDAINPETGREEAGFYVSGGVGTKPEEKLREADITYFPENRFLKSSVLQLIKQAGKLNPRKREVLEYAVMLGAASILAKHAVIPHSLSLPIYVGFDSGDFLLASIQKQKKGATSVPPF
jgi:hypothetical protein